MDGDLGEWVHTTEREEIVNDLYAKSKCCYKTARDWYRGIRNKTADEQPRHFQLYKKVVSLVFVAMHIPGHFTKCLNGNLFVLI